MRPVTSHSIPLITRASVRGAGSTAGHAWRRTVVQRLVAADAVCAAVAALLAARVASDAGAALVPVAAITWVAALWLGRGYEQRFLEAGPEEFRRVVRTTLVLLGALGVSAWCLGVAVPRDAAVLGLAVACLLTLAHRCAQRGWLRRQHALGRGLRTMLLVGHRDAVAAFADRLARDTRHGYRVAGCCLPSTAERSLDGLPVLGRLDDVARVADFYEVDAVAVLSAPEPDGGALRRLGCALEHIRVELLLAPALTELAGPRVAVRPLLTLPLLHAEQPALRGVDRLVKGAVDRTLALLALVVILPVLLAVAVAVRTTGPGPVLDRQERVGRGGRTVRLHAFRTTQGDGSIPPRVPATTPVGRLLRAHGLDQLPRLLDVAGGRVSLVGPRPAFPGNRFAAHAEPVADPGLTGLWPLGGRSGDVAWGDETHLDVHYVRNWSLALDLMILVRTARAALRHRPGG